MREKIHSARPGAVETRQQGRRTGKGSVDYGSFLAADTFAVFLFHGVVKEHRYAVRNYIRKHISEETFVTVLRSLLKQGTAVPLDEAAAAAAGGERLPKNAFVVTFDDGFANNYSIAAPILAELNVPATFYVTTDFVDRNTAGWIDMIEAGVEVMPSVHADLPELGIRGTYSTATEKISLLRQLRNKIYQDRAIDPNRFAEDFLRQIKAPPFVPSEDLDQKMSWQQVEELDRNPLFSLGAHSHTHPILSYLDEAELAKELDVSLGLLEQHIGHKVRHFAYPQGLDFCYSDQVIAALKERGIVCCPTAERGVNRLSDDPFRWKRIMVT